MEKIIIDLEAKTDKALKGIDNVAESVKDLNKTVTKGNKDTASGLKLVEKSSELVGKGIKGIGTALKAAGIGLVLGLLATLKDLFEQNQKAVDLFNIVFETSANVVGQVVNAFTDIYDAVSKSKDNFDALGKVMSGLMTLVINPLIINFNYLRLGIQAVQLGWEKMFGDEESVEKARQSIVDTTETIKDLALESLEAGKDIYDNFSEAVSEVGAIGKTVVKELSEVSVSAAYETAKANVELQKSAELAAARQGLIFETFDRQAEKLRQIRDDETKSITERKKANDELLVKIAEAEESMLAQAKLQLALANQNLQKDKDNVEFKVAQIEAEKELAGVRAQIEGIRSEQMSNANALDRESLELINAKTESESNLSIAKEKFAAEQILNEQLRLEKLIEINEAEKIIEEERLQAIVDLANGGTQAKIDAQIALDDFTNTNNEENVQLKKDLGLKEVANEKAVADAKASIRQGNLSNIGSSFALLGQLAGKNKALQSAALIGESAVGIAKTIINTQAANSAAVLKYALLPGGLALAAAEKTINNIGAGISIATNVAATAKGLSQLGGGGSAPAAGSVGGNGGGGSAPAMPSLPPAFNVVGASDTNQLADAIGGQSQEPVKAYVVSGDVTSAQSMDRNIVEGASI